MRTALCSIGLAVPLLLAGCEEKPPASGTGTASPTAIPAPFTEKDHVVPVALDPNRPQPPAPGPNEVSRSQERFPPEAQQAPAPQQP